MQPAWRNIGVKEGPLGLEDRFQGGNDWSKLNKPGQNGLLSVLAALAWWGQGIQKTMGANAAMLCRSWEAALDDFWWVLVALLEQL